MEGIVFAGSSCEVLGKEIAEELACEYGKVIIKRFPDGELYLRVLSEVEGKTCIVVQSICKPQDSNFFELIALQDTLKDLNAKEIITVVPYYGYGRQDKRFNAGECLSSKVIAEHIQQSCDKFYTINVHKEKILEFFNIPAKNLDASPLLGEYFKSYREELHSPVVLAPDEGAISLAKSVAKVLGCKYDYLEKKRIAPGEVEMKPKNLEVKGRDVIIVDDIIDSGGTMLKAIEMLKKQGATGVFVACIHAVLTGNVVTQLFSHAIDVIATNTIPSQISFITVAPLISRALKK